MRSLVSRREMMGRALAGVLSTGSIPIWKVWAGVAEKARPSARDAPSLPVAIRRCRSYEPAVVERELSKAIDLIGGIGNLVRGKTVAVKLNLTGDPRGKAKGLASFRTYQVHPNIVASLASIMARHGAKRIVLVDALYMNDPIEKVLSDAGWDLAAIQAAGAHAVELENTRNRGRWPSYSRMKVPWGGYIFPAYDVNPWYEKADVLVSVAKLKDHLTTGFTMAAKNLFGITPTSLYGDDAPNETSTRARLRIFHDGSRPAPGGVPQEIDPKSPRDPAFRVPRVTADIAGLRPVDLSVVDGVESIKGGEGPWIKEIEPVQPGLILAGRNMVTTDAVAASAMGYDPTAGAGTPPFIGGNHLELLARAGLGANDPGGIEVRGLGLRDALFEFNPKLAPKGWVRRHL